MRSWIVMGAGAVCFCQTNFRSYAAPQDSGRGLLASLLAEIEFLPLILINADEPSIAKN
jgi:hypothetical protein